MSVGIDVRNKAFVNFAAACLGELTRNVRRVDFAMEAEHTYRVRFVLREDSARDREAIQEILENFEAMREPPYDQLHRVDLAVIVDVGNNIRPPLDSEYLGLYCEE